MTGRSSPGNNIRPLVYLSAVLLLALLIFFEVTGAPIPFVSRDESLLDHDHIHEGEVAFAELEPGQRVGDAVPFFELGLADGSTLTRTDLVESGRPTFLYFWATN